MEIGLIKLRGSGSQGTRSGRAKSNAVTKLMTMYHRSSKKEIIVSGGGLLDEMNLGLGIWVSSGGQKGKAP